MKTIEAIFGVKKGPILLCGDFNSWNRAKTNYLMELILRYGLNAVFFAPAERSNFVGYPLDYVFYRGIRIHHSKGHKNISVADHIPLTVSFSLIKENDPPFKRWHSRSCK